MNAATALLCWSGRHPFPGTFAVRPETLRAGFMDLAAELGDQGFRWTFMAHGHGSPDPTAPSTRRVDYFRHAYGGRTVRLLGRVVKTNTRSILEAEMGTQAVNEDGLALLHAGVVEHRW